LAAVAGAELGADNLSVLVGAVSGIAAGAVAEWAQERRARDDTPLPPDPGPIP
jgi:hypothetical protein